MQETSWVDRAAYPFTPRYFASDDGRMHYVDEGQGAPIIMVHGTPTWSFLYRDLIHSLTPRYRCIAPDHLGFGLSAKPPHAPYRPADHARRLHALIEHLELRDFTLIVHDFGGPIGLSYAVAEPHNVRSLVLFNTWMWSLRGEPVPEMGGILGRGRIGTLVFQRLNLELRLLFRAVWGDRSKLSRALHQQYLNPFPQPRDRQAIQTLARELRDSSAWYEGLWRQRERIQDIPALLLWGLKDPIFKARHLARWQALFTSAQTVTFPKAGHFVQEEERAAVGRRVEQFLAAQRGEDTE